MDIIKRNGFDIQETSDGRLFLTAVPFSKNITFGARDVQELAQLLLEGASTPNISGQPHAKATMLTSQALRPSRCCRIRQLCLLLSMSWMEFLMYCQYSSEGSSTWKHQVVRLDRVPRREM